MQVTDGTLDRIAAALGFVPKVAYEAAHVYPMSAPAFEPNRAVEREPHLSGPLKLYVHVPFCNYACHFCFYAKRIGTQRPKVERYVAALERELEWIAPGTPLTQLYLGGGTPTVLPADLLDRLLAAIFAQAPPAPGLSRTVESSPESLSTEHVRVLRARGVERVSMGVQSLDPAVLEAINRRHSGQQAIDACAQLAEAGFIFNVDLIYGLPRQSEASFRADLETLARQRPDSFTIYDLRVNEQAPLGSALASGENLDLRRLMDWRGLVRDATAALGYRQTRWHTFVRDDQVRTSAYHRAPCIDGFAAGSQLGIGMSAVSHLGELIYRNCDGFDAYIDRIERGSSPVDETFALADEDYRTLFVARTLGDGEHLDRALYARTFGNPIESDFGDTLARLSSAGLTETDGDELMLSDSGRLVYDLITLAFYPPRAQRWLNDRQQLLEGG